MPHPREHLLTYHGVLAPASSWRDFVVPVIPHESERVEPTRASPPDSSLPESLDSPESAEARLTAACPDVPLPAPSVSTPPSSYSTSYSWAELLRRVFSVDVLACPTCGSRRRLIALISDPPVVRRILRHLHLPAEPPRLAPLRSPPQMAFGY